MPRVPIPDANALRSRPLPVVTGPLGGPYEAVEDAGRGLAGAGVALARIGMEERERADEVRVTEAVGKYTADETTVLFDPTTGALTRKGRQAIGATPGVVSALEKRGREIGAELTEGAQRAAFSRWFTTKLLATRETLLRHEANETESHDAASYAATVDGFRQQAGLLWSQPEAIERSIADTKTAIDSRGYRAGWDEAQTAAELRTRLTALHQTVLEGIPDDRPDLSEAYLAAHGDEMDPARSDPYRRAIATASREKRAQAEADRLYGRPGLEEDLGPVLENALAGAAALDADIRDTTENRIRQLHADTTRVRAVREDELTRMADEQYRAGGDRISAISPKIWEKLPLARRRAFEADQARGGDETLSWDDVSDEAWRDYQAYYAMKPGDRVRLDLVARFGRRLPPAAVARLIDEQAAENRALEDPKKSAEHLTALRSADEQIALAAKRAGMLDWKGKPKGTEERQFEAFRDAMQVSLTRFEREQLGGKRKANSEEIQKIADDLLIRESEARRVTAPFGMGPILEWVGIGQGERRFKYERPIEGAPPAAEPPPESDIPDDFRRELAVALRARGFHGEPSEDTVRRYWERTSAWEGAAP